MPTDPETPRIKPTPPHTNQARGLWVMGLVLLASGVLVGESLGWPFLRQPLQAALSTAAQRPVTLGGDFRAHLLWRPQLSVERLHVAPGGDMEVSHLLLVQHLDVRWQWLEVWRWWLGDALRLQALGFTSLDAQLLRAANGQASWQPAPPQAAQADPAPTSPDIGALLAKLPHVGQLQLGPARVRVDDALTQTQLLVDLKVLPAQTSPPGGATSYEASVLGQWKQQPVELKVLASRVVPLLSDAVTEEQAGTLQVEGGLGEVRVFFAGTAKALLTEKRQLAGDFRLSAPSLAKLGEPLAMPLPTTPPVDLRGRVAYDSQVWRVRADTARMGRSQLNADLALDTRPQRPVLKGHIGGARLMLVDLGPSIGAGVKGTQSGKALPQRRLDFPALGSMDAELSVAIAALDFGSPDIAPLQQLKAQVQLQAGLLKLDALSARVAGGAFKGSSSLDSNTTPAQWTADVAFSGIDIAQWVKGLRSSSQTVDAYITGVLQGRVQGSGRGRSTAEILGSLNGQATLRLTEGTLSHLLTELVGLDLAQALGVLVQSDQSLRLRCAVVDVQIRQGLMSLRRAVMDNSDSTLRVVGNVNLRDERLNLQGLVEPKDFSPLSLRVPIIVSGTLASPDVGVDRGRLAGKAAGALALGLLAGPLAALLPLVDTGVEPDEDPCQTASPGR